jgi:hypothetical protein
VLWTQRAQDVVDVLLSDGIAGGFEEKAVAFWTCVANVEPGVKAVLADYVAAGGDAHSGMELGINGLGIGLGLGIARVKGERVAAYVTVLRCVCVGLLDLL